MKRDANGRFITDKIELDMTAKEAVINGVKYKLTEVEKKVTLEDCITTTVRFRMLGSGRNMPCLSGSPFPEYDLYPTESIAEKVFLFGLLHSVAWKLNGGKVMKDGYLVGCRGLFGTIQTNGLYVTIDPIFATKALAEQAIRIFEESKFDLGGLYQ